jgi:serine/threonine protein phosphatase 1
MSRIFVIGDIHGACLALKECLELAEFDYKSDRLICLGDVADGWPDVKNAIDELLKIENLIYIMGNHDEWLLKWFISGRSNDLWLKQGGNSTIKTYAQGIPENHVNFLQKARDYYIENNRLFVHGGIDPDIPIEEQNREIFLWNRSLVSTAAYLTSLGNCVEFGSYQEIYVGHTPTLNFDSIVPLKFCNVWLMDTGAGWHGGSLSMMEVYTGKLFISHPVHKLYPKFKGRRKLF